MNPDQPPDHFYASSVREEVWAVDGEHSRLLEERRESGFAVFRNRESVPWILAGDHPGLLGPDERALIGVDPAGLLPMLEATVDQGDSALLMTLQRFAALTPLRARVTRKARYVSNGNIDDAHLTAFLVVTQATPGLRRSIVCTEGELETHLDLFAGQQRPPTSHAVDLRGLSIVWSGGSASVLLHEAIGHPAERGIAPFGLPDWVQVADRPTGTALGSMSFDDCAVGSTNRRLSDGELPSCFRRESFRAIPLRRMSNLQAEVTSDAPPVALPGRYIVVRLVGEGAYDPLHDTVTLSIAVAELIDESGSTLIAPFRLEGKRPQILRSFVAGEGPSMLYPGVLCSEDGQRLPVGSSAPLLLTDSWSRS